MTTTVANLRIEDLHLDDESKRIFQRHVDSEIGDKEFHAAIDGPTSGGSDPYLYPGTDVLGTFSGLRDPGQLAAFETFDRARRTYGSAESAQDISSQGS